MLLPPVVDAVTLRDHAQEPWLRTIHAPVHSTRPTPAGPYVTGRGHSTYPQGHIPGAAFADLCDDHSDAASPLPVSRPTVERCAAAAGRSESGRLRTSWCTRGRRRSGGCDCGGYCATSASMRSACSTACRRGRRWGSRSGAARKSTHASRGRARAVDATLLIHALSPALFRAEDHVSATVDLFSRALVGAEHGRVYDGSPTEWAADPDAPLEVR